MPDLTITLTATQAQKIAEAVGHVRHYVDEAEAPRAATLPEVRTFVVEHLKTIVMEVALSKARATVASAGTDLNLV